LHQPQARVTADAFASLWLAVARELDDEFFGLDRRRMKVGSFGLLCRAALHGCDLGHALQRLSHGFGLVFDDLSARLQVSQRQATVQIHNRIAEPAARRFADETLLVMLHGVLCWLAGRRVPLQAVDFAHPRPPHASEYRAMFCQQLQFDAPFKAFLQAAPRSVFLKYRNPDGWSARLRRRLRTGLDAGKLPGFDDLALELHVAPTTLRRRLEAEGTSFQAIKDDLRRDTAIHLLVGGRRSVELIAADLGFGEPSAFRRAFKKWTGVQPRAYRACVASPASRLGAVVRAGHEAGRCHGAASDEVAS
jgi:AraC-like DNA-binding protein